MFEDGRIIPRRLSMQKVQEYRIIKSKLRNANSQMPLITAKLIFYYKLKFFRSYINLAFPFFFMREQMEAEVMSESRRSSIVEKKVTTEKVKDQFSFFPFCSLLSVSFCLELKF